MSEENKANQTEEIITEEGYVLRPRPRPSTDVTIRVPLDALASIDRVAAHRGMSREALLRFYIGHELQQDLTRLHAQRIMETTEQALAKHLHSEETIAAILQEIQTATAASTYHHSKEPL
jgi:hypothetical protein